LNRNNWNFYYRKQCYFVNNASMDWKVLRLVYIYGITFDITGSKKWRDEGATLFAVRVDGVVSPCNIV